MLTRIVKAVRLIFLYPQKPKICVRTHCERTNHLWMGMPNEESPDFEFCGMNPDGKMVYQEIVREHYTCSRCGESYIKTSRKHVYH
jgi:hypothetical protein